MISKTSVILPATMTQAMLVSTTAANTEATWTAGSYGLGVFVNYPVTVNGVLVPRRFRSLVASNTFTPGADATKWLDVGPSNRWAMFTNRVGEKTTASNSLTVVLNPGRFVTTMGLFGLSGTTVRIEVKDGTTTLFDQTANITSRVVTTMLEYLYNTPVQLDRAIFRGMPAIPGNTITITVTGTNCAIGACVMGTAFDMGSAPKLGADWQLSEYLGVTRDEFGSVDLRPDGPYSDTNTYTVYVPTERLIAFRSQMIRLRSTPTVWICDGEDPRYNTLLVNFGVRDEGRLLVEHDQYSIYEFTVIGMT